MGDPTQHEIALDNALISLYCFRPTPGDDKAIIDNARATVDICFRAAVAAETKPYREYITFLEKVCWAAEQFRSVHGIQPSEEDIAKGERLRAAILATVPSPAESTDAP